ncbi:MAG: hypothetical protein QM723_40690 [Myxococcaceae bacterium]
MVAWWSPPGFAAKHRADGFFFAALVALIWLGILGGFIPEIVAHVRAGKAAYPPIIHVHGAVFGGWLVVLTAQLALVRTGNLRLHRSFGLAGVGLAAVMMVVGPLTAYTMDRLEFGTPDDNTPFFFVQLTDMLSFGVLASAAFVLRNHGAAHKRLILLATLYISDAGFSRLLGDPVHNALGDGRVAYFLGLYLGNDLLILALGAYDLLTRRRLHPVYLAAIAWVVVVQLVSVHYRWDPGWLAVATKLLG